jgi:uncharacterized membrane protein (UPF0127 family)
MPSKELRKIKVEVADTPNSRSFGLMYRKALDTDSGMLFVFSNKRQLSFWGANTYMPLDLAFISEGKIVDIKKIVPLSTRPVKCETPCDVALEVSSNFFKNNNIIIGSTVTVNGDEVTFLS